MPRATDTTARCAGLAHTTTYHGFPARRWQLHATLGPFTALPAAPRLARMFTVIVLNGWGFGRLADDAELIAGELAANVVGAASERDGRSRSGFGEVPPELWLYLLGNRTEVRLEVWDSVPERYGLPAINHPGPEAESGWGLSMVDALSSDWGWEVLPSREAKRVWALLEVQNGPGPESAGGDPAGVDRPLIRPE